MSKVQLIKENMGKIEGMNKHLSKVNSYARVFSATCEAIAGHLKGCSDPECEFTLTYCKVLVDTAGSMEDELRLAADKAGTFIAVTEDRTSKH